MASSSNSPPPPDVAMHAYVDQKLQEQAQAFHQWLDVLGEQIKQLTAAFGTSTMISHAGGRVATPFSIPPSPQPPLRIAQRDPRTVPMPPNADPGGTHHRPLPMQLQPRGPFPPRPFGPPMQQGTDPPPPLYNMATPPEITLDNHTYMDDLPLYGTDEFDGDDNDVLPPFTPLLAANNDQAHRRWETRFKLGIPEFHGTHNADEFLDWLTAIEQVFQSAGVPSHARVGLAITKFRGGALAWWRALLSRRTQVDEPPVNTWEELRREMKTTFLPYRHKQQLFSKLCNLRQGSQSVQQYTETFYNLLARNEVVESNDKFVARYLSGLRLDLQDKLQGFYFLTVEQVVPKAEAFENQALQVARRAQTPAPLARPPHLTTGRQPAPSMMFPTRGPQPSSLQTPPRGPLPPPQASYTAGRPGITYFECHKTGHLVASCPCTSQSADC